jgi:hypothetical protein
MFVNNHTCCALVLLFGTNCPYKCRNNCQIFAIRRVIFYLFAITFFPAVKLHVFGYWTFVELSILTAVDKVKDCEKIIEHTGTPVNIIYYSVALIQYEYTSKEIIISLIRSYSKLLLLYCFFFIWIDRNYFLLQAWPKLAYLWSHEWFIIWWIYWLKIKHIYILTI